MDVVVAGATIAGLCAARWLAERGARVVLAGPGGPDDLGLLLAGLGEHPARLRTSLGDAGLRELVGLAGVSAELLGVERVPQVWAAVVDNELPLVGPSVRALVDVGFQADALDAEGLARYGVQAERGFVLRGGAALLDPAATLERWTAAARDAGVNVATDLTVDRVDQDVEGLRIVLGPAVVRAEVIVVASGGAAPRLSDWFADKSSPVREQALLVDGALPPLGGRAGHGWTVFRPWPGAGGAPGATTPHGGAVPSFGGPAGEPSPVSGSGRVAVGGCRWATAHLEVGETEAAPVPAIQDRIEAFARGRLGLTGAVGRRWAWIEHHGCDGLPLVGPVPGSTRWIACFGFGGAEWSLGPAAARMVVDGLLGGEMPTPRTLAPSRFVG